MRATKITGESPIAARVRARIAELGTTESALAERMGWQRTVLSTILRRLDATSEANIRTDTLRKLELALGKPAQWILTGIEPEGVRLADCNGWGDAAVEARRRGVPEDTIHLVGESRVPRALRIVDASLIRQLADAL